MIALQAARWRRRTGSTAALGTGSVFGVQRGGAVRMIGGWGFLLGDQGSGARLGRALCEAALLAHDGSWRPARRCSAAVVAEAGGPAGLVVFGQARPRRISRALVPRLVAAAAAGDAAAEAILAEAEASVAGAIDLLPAARRCRSASSAGSGRSSPAAGGAIRG